MRWISSFGLGVLVMACGSSAKPVAAPAAPPPTSQTGQTDQTAATTTATAATPVSAEFDRAAAARAIAAVDVSPCYEKPPLLDARLHVTMEVLPTGRVEPTADRPYAGTEAGNCAVALFRDVRVPPWIGTPRQMGRTVPHAPPP